MCLVYPEHLNHSSRGRNGPDRSGPYCRGYNLLLYSLENVFTTWSQGSQSQLAQIKHQASSFQFLTCLVPAVNTILAVWHIYLTHIWLYGRSKIFGRQWGTWTPCQVELWEVFYWVGHLSVIPTEGVIGSMIHLGTFGKSHYVSVCTLGCLKFPS